MTITTTSRIGIRLGCLLLLNVLAIPVPGQPPQDHAARRSALGERQRLVERKMVELENMFTQIADRLQEKEPERAQRLVAAYQQAKETLITRKMAEVSEHLDRNEFDQAGRKIDEVIQRLDDLVRLLTGASERKMSKQDEINMLENWKRTIQQIRTRQHQQRRETSKVADKEKSLRKLDEQIKKVSELIDQQRKLLDQTKQQAGQGLRAMDRIADQQFDIRQQTEKLAREIADDEMNRPKDPGKDDPSNRSEETKPGDRTDPPSPAGNAKPSGEPKNRKDDPAASGKPSGDASGKPGGDPSRGKPSSPGTPPAAQPPQPGQKPLQQAADQQRQAEERLGSGRGKAAEKAEQKAIENLERARAELAKERRRLASLPPEAFEQMAQDQRRLRDKALDLKKKMAEAPRPSSDGDDPNAQSPKQQPGQQAMQDAGQAMKGASKDLQQQEAKPAARKQKLAEKKLDEALQEIEERLEQLRDETREEKLKALEARFREMLDRQRAATAATTELNDKQVNLGSRQPRDDLTIIRLATEEAEIGELGQQAYDLLLEDGTSDVFPEIVQDVSDDLKRVAELLDQGQTSQLTQLIQRDIESVLLDLLDALEESKQPNDSKGGGGGGGGGKQPLLKLSAELKILRSAQRRLNRRTIRIDSLREEGVSDDLEQRLTEELDTMADLQRKLLEMTEQIIEKQNNQ